MAPRPSCSTGFLELLFTCFIVLFGILKENLVAATNADAFASCCEDFVPVELELLFCADLTLRCQWDGLASSRV
jgi:hypothetical protein